MNLVEKHTPVAHGGVVLDVNVDDVLIVVVETIVVVLVLDIKAIEICYFTDS